MAVDPHGHAVDPLPPVLLQLLSNPGQLGADDPSSLQQELQVITSAVL